MAVSVAIRLHGRRIVDSKMVAIYFDAKYARQAPKWLMSSAPAKPEASQINPLTWLPSASVTLPIPKGAGMPATKLPNSLAGSDHTFKQVATALGELPI